MKRQRSGHLKDTWKLGALFYLLAFNFPLLEIFNRSTQVLGIPLLVLFLFGLWLLFIALMALFVHRLRRREEGARDGDGGDG